MRVRVRGGLGFGFGFGLLPLPLTLSRCVLPHGGRGIECSNGQCIHESYACDGAANCP